MYVAPASDNASRLLAGCSSRPYRSPGFHCASPSHHNAITNQYAKALITIFRTACPYFPTNHPSSLTTRRDRLSFESRIRVIVMATTLLIVSSLLSPIPAMSATPVTAAPSTWQWPLNGSPRILRRFAPPPEPWLTGHRGVDLAATVAAPVLAAGQGTIGYAGSVGGRGVVTVDHPGGLRTTYLPVAAAVRPGDAVSPGDRLGIVEPGSPHCPESCLHWGLRRASAYLDPLLLLGRARIRLLPYWHAMPPPTITPTPPTATSTPAPSPHRPLDDHTRGRGDLAGDAAAPVEVARLDEKKRPSHQPLAPAKPVRHHTPAPVAALGHFSPRSAATPMLSALGIAALLAVLILLTLLRYLMRTNRSPRDPVGGRHSARSDHPAMTDDRCHTTGQHRKPRRRRPRRK